MDIVAISGSLRSASINSAFCRVAAQLAPAPISVKVYGNIAALPLFNPDLETAPPRVVLEFRAIISAAEVLIVASPEYAHGISGVMKNALDWLVSDEAVVAKPVALINTSSRAQHAYDALREVLKTMSTVLIGEASLTIPLLGMHVTERAMLAAPEVRQSVNLMFAAIAAHLGGKSSAGPSFPLNWNSA